MLAFLMTSPYSQFWWWPGLSVNWLSIVLMQIPPQNELYYGIGEKSEWRWKLRCCYILKVKRVVSENLPDRCFSPFYLIFYEYDMLIEREVCLFSLLFKITVNSLLRISVISFSQHKNYITVKFAVGCIQLNEKLVARLKIGQFWNETGWILWTRDPSCCYQVLHKIFHCKRIELTVKLASEGIQWYPELVSWPKTGRIKL